MTDPAVPRISKGDHDGQPKIRDNTFVRVAHACRCRTATEMSERKAAWVLLLCVATSTCHGAIFAREGEDVAHYSRKLAQDVFTSTTEGSAQSLTALPAVCKVVRGSSTSTCHSTCKICKDTAGDPSRRACACCPPGHSLLGTSRCSKCPVGTFAREGDNACTTCPNGLTTLKAGSTTCDGECQSLCELFKLHNLSANSLQSDMYLACC